ncbi:MAG TPA: aldehyde dehydrogenase family protein, partial [Xanthobacteraceae bacterium]
MRNELYIDGQWVKPVNGETRSVIDPATEEVIQTISAASAADVDIAVKAARRAFDKDGWPKLSGAQRAKYLRAIAKGIRHRQEEIARLETIDNGKPFPEAMWDIGDAAGCFEYYAGLAEELDKHPEEKIQVSDGRFTSKAVKEPIGVAGAIIPWNYPLLMAAW